MGKLARSIINLIKELGLPRKIIHKDRTSKTYHLLLGGSNKTIKWGDPWTITLKFKTIIIRDNSNKWSTITKTETHPNRLALLKFLVLLVAALTSSQNTHHRISKTRLLLNWTPKRSEGRETSHKLLIQTKRVDNSNTWTCRGKTGKATQPPTPLSKLDNNQTTAQRSNLRYTSNSWMETIKKQTFKATLSSQSNLTPYKPQICRIHSLLDKTKSLSHRTVFNQMPLIKTNSTPSSIKRLILDLWRLIKDLRILITFLWVSRIRETGAEGNHLHLARILRVKPLMLKAKWKLLWSKMTPLLSIKHPSSTNRKTSMNPSRGNFCQPERLRKVKTFIWEAPTPRRGTVLWNLKTAEQFQLRNQERTQLWTHLITFELQFRKKFQLLKIIKLFNQDKRLRNSTTALQSLHSPQRLVTHQKTQTKLIKTLS